MSIRGLMLHCGGEPATIDDLGAVPMPEATDTHQPVAHDVFVRMVLERIGKVGLEVRRTAFGLNKSGAQMFGVIQCDAMDDETGIMFGLRSSHDKSMSKGLAGGRSVFVCDNLVFSGSDFVVMRKHTRNVLDDLHGLVAEAVDNTGATQRRIGAAMLAMKHVPCPTEVGFDILGRAYGGELLNSRQATRAFAEWRSPTAVDFEDRTLWSLYNAGTEALKLGAVRGTIRRHIAWHDHIVGSEIVEDPPAVVALGEGEKGSDLHPVERQRQTWAAAAYLLRTSHNPAHDLALSPLMARREDNLNALLS